MYLGIKIGPKNWRAKLESKLTIRHVEVYFDLARGADYQAMFAALRERGIQAGLHASSQLPGGIWCNVITEDREVRSSSIDLFERTIDVAAEKHMRFIVIHPGAFRIPALRGGRVVMVKGETSLSTGQELLQEAAAHLIAYGRARAVHVWMENLPGLEFASYDPEDRVHTADPLFPSHQVLLAMAQRGAGLCLDLAHLLAEVNALGWVGEEAWQRVGEISRQMAPYVRHLHLSTIAPPWNGTDSHNGFLADDYALDAVPAPDQVIAWLSSFAGRDLWVIPEPYGGADVHLRNYRQIASWMEQIE